MFPGWGHLIAWMDPSVGHLNGILARVGGNLNKNFQKSQMPGGCPGGGMLKLRFDRYITTRRTNQLNQTKSQLINFPPNKAKYTLSYKFSFFSLVCRIWRSAFVPETIFRRSIRLKLACVADPLNLLYTHKDECVGRLQRRLSEADQ